MDSQCTFSAYLTDKLTTTSVKKTRKESPSFERERLERLATEGKGSGGDRAGRWDDTKEIHEERHEYEVIFATLHDENWDDGCN